MIQAILAVLSLASTPTDTDTDRLIQAHTEARGGAAAIEAVQTIEVQLIINEGWQADAIYRATREGDMRIDVFIEGERVFTEGLHEGQAWAMQQGETRGSPITDEEARILWRGVLGNLYGLHEYRRHNVALMAGSDPDSGDPVLDITHDDGFEDRLYLDPHTHLVTRQRSDHALHPAVDPTVRRHETRYSDFRTVDGVTYAFRQEKYDLDTGEQVQWTQTRSITLNTIEDRSIFAMPQ